MTKLREYVLDRKEYIVEPKNTPSTAMPSNWAGIFALDVPEVYLSEGLDSKGIPVKLPKKAYLQAYYKEAKDRGIGFNVYALARTLKSERGPLVKGYNDERWQRFAGQYKAIGSCILCRMLGYASMPMKEDEVEDKHVFGPQDSYLYCQTTGLVKLVVAGKHVWGPFSKPDNNRQGAAFATGKDIDPDNTGDQTIIEVATKILNGTWFIGDDICGATSFNHPKGLMEALGIYNKLDDASISKAISVLNKESPYGHSVPSNAMGGAGACWTGRLPTGPGYEGLAPTQIIFYARMPRKVSPMARYAPVRLPWCERTLPRLAEPPGFDMARSKGLLRDDGNTSQPVDEKAAPDSGGNVVIRPVSEQGND